MPPKRKSDQSVGMSDGELEKHLEDIPMESCDVVRRKIRALIDSGEMKVGEFQKAINANSTSYSGFMSQNGAFKGAGSTVYQDAWAFFKKRELRGVPAPKKRAKTVAGASGPDVDISDVQLEGEMEDRVPVYDTCDEIRRRINAYLKKPGVTQAQFLRDIAAQFHAEPKKPQQTQLSAFRSKKRPYAGNTSSIFYGSYVFFEKRRIKEGKPKGKKRLEMEAIWAKEGGMTTDRRRDSVWAPADASVSQDKYGRIHIERMGKENVF